MTRTTIATLAVILIGAVLAFQLGGREGMGVVAGVLCGTSVSMLGAGWSRHNFRTRPQRAFQAVVEVFLFKLAFLLLGALSFRYIEAAAARVALVIQTVAVLDSVRLLKNPPAGSGSTPGGPSLAQTPTE